MDARPETIKFGISESDLVENSEKKGSKMAITAEINLIAQK